MTTSRRLAILETQTPGTSTRKNLEPLCELLGSVDGLFAPHRQFGGRVSVLTSIVQQRRQYLASGIVWSLADGSARGWKQAQRLRDSMQAEGLITVSRDGELRVRLTVKGDRIARTALGLPSLDSWLTRRLLELLTELEPDRPGGWVSEFTLAGTGDRNGLADCLLPLLSGGIVESLSDTEGRIYYRSTGEPLQTSPEDDPESTIDEPGDQLTEIYQSAFEAALSSRQRIEPADSEIIVPLSASRP